MQMVSCEIIVFLLVSYVILSFFRNVYSVGCFKQFVKIINGLYSEQLKLVLLALLAFYS